MRKLFLYHKKKGWFIACSKVIIDSLDEEIIFVLQKKILMHLMVFVMLASKKKRITHWIMMNVCASQKKKRHFMIFLYPHSWSLLTSRIVSRDSEYWYSVVTVNIFRHFFRQYFEGVSIQNMTQTSLKPN